MIIYIFICVTIVCYLWLRWRFLYWSRQGLETYKTSFFENIGSKSFNAYFHFKQKNVKHGGTFIFFKPVYIPVDLEVLKNILQTDFNHFVNHGFVKDPPPIIKNLLHMEDEEWRIWRARLTPTFTTGKMKMMFHTMLEKASILEDVYKEQATINEAIDIKEIVSRYTTDIIGSTAFGIECNSLKDPNADFRKFGKKLLERFKSVGVILTELPPVILKIFGLKYISEETESFFVNAIKDTVHYRESNNVYRKDVMHLLIQLKNKGKIIDENEESVLSDENKQEHISLIQIVAQCLVFFGAGYDTSATAITFAMLELAQNQDIQDKLRTEINNILKAHGGKVTYEAIMQMEYLDKVVSEALRKHPPAQLFTRLCNKDYRVPGSNITLKKGQQVILPFRAIHYDPEHWPEPEKFDPERFCSENKATRHRFAYLPFGEGPRMCIGARFGLLQTKIGIALSIKNFRFTISDKTPKPIHIDSANLGPEIKGTLWLDIEKVE